ncbi:hypothetical protein [Neorhizobium sp. DT-125]|uniref:hypothetical protein n=1 Tax=Neorhizobium sp. DT-125 TaxID=3396163 RepID=UPI003F1DE714
MTIAERKAREAHDRENPWRPMSEARVGLISDLLFDDMCGHYPAEGCYFVLDADGWWYRTDIPDVVYAKPINWRPAHVYMTPERRALTRRRAREYRRR